MGDTSQSSKQGKPGRGPGADEAAVRCRWEAPRPKNYFSFFYSKFSGSPGTGAAKIVSGTRSTQKLYQECVRQKLYQERVRQKLYQEGVRQQLYQERVRQQLYQEGVRQQLYQEGVADRRRQEQAALTPCIHSGHN